MKLTLLVLLHYRSDECVNSVVTLPFRLVMYSTLSSQISSAIAILLNLILFVLTFKFTPSAMADYSRIIRLNCFLDVIIDFKIFFSLNVSVYGTKKSSF
jgi:hypothetical protein